MPNFGALNKTADKRLFAGIEKNRKSIAKKDVYIKEKTMVLFKSRDLCIFTSSPGETK